MKKNVYNIWFVFFFLAILIWLYSCTQIEAYIGAKKNTVNQEEQIVYVPSFITINELTDLLFKSEIVDDTSAFHSILKYKKFTDEMIGAGKYIISPKTSYQDLINGFTKNSLGNGNKEVEAVVTFNNCKDIFDVAGKVSKQIEMDSSDFINYIFSDTVLQTYGFNKNTIGSIFIPNTYHLYWDTNSENFVKRMASEFKKFWTDDRKAQLKNIGLHKQSDAVILASIVYQEQNKHPEEWPVISGLYLNRLRKGMRLESDPTFRFCWGSELDGVERLTYLHRDIDCPYNTYKYAGLPPGPIYIPPAKVVDAVLNPDKNDYLFMCAKPEVSGLHNFAKNLSQHNKNATVFQTWIRAQQRLKRNSNS